MEIDVMSGETLKIASSGHVPSEQRTHSNYQQ